MSTPYDPGRPEDRPADQPAYPPQQYPQFPQGGEQYPQGGEQYPQGGQQYPQGGQPGSSHQAQQGYPPAPDPNAPQQDYGSQPYAGGPSYGDAPSYGNAPAYSNQGFGQPPGRPDLTAPAEVLRAVQLMFARVVISVLGAIIAFTSGDAVKDSIRGNDPTLSSADVDRAYNIGVGVAVFFGLVFAVLYILLAIQVRKGKNWARIVTFVLAGLGVLGGLLGLFGDGTGLEKGLSVLQLLVDAAIIFFLTRKPSNEYFAAMKAPRH